MPRPAPTTPTTDNGLTASQLQLYPNPTDGRLTIDLTAFLEQAATLEILDLNGQLILRRELGLIEQSTERLDLSAYPAGIYFVRLRLDDGTTALRRVVVQPRP